MTPQYLQQKRAEFESLFFKGRQVGPIIHLRRVYPETVTNSDSQNHGQPFPEIYGEFWRLLDDFRRDFGVYSCDEEGLLALVLKLGHLESIVVELTEIHTNGAGIADWEITRLTICPCCGGMVP